MPATPLILASASPRRRELLAYLGVGFTVLPASVDESIPDVVVDSAAVARRLAEDKAHDISSKHPGAAVLAADTIVVVDGRILGKPADAAEAKQMLQSLRNRAHEVTTAIALAHDTHVRSEHTTTQVIMRDYTDSEIDDYIATGDPFDKAGSYAIQDRQFKPVASCEGCYCNVVGLSIVLLQRMLEEACVEILDLRPPDLPPHCAACPLLNRNNTFSPMIGI